MKPLPERVLAERRLLTAKGSYPHRHPARFLSGAFLQRHKRVAMLAVARPGTSQAFADEQHVDAQPVAGIEIPKPPPVGILQPWAVFEAHSAARELAQTFGGFGIASFATFSRVVLGDSS